VIVKVTIALAAVLLASALMRRAAAATRHAILIAGQLAALLLPLLANVVPPVTVDAPVILAHAATEVLPAIDRTPYEPPTERSLPTWPRVAPIVWSLGFLVIASRRVLSCLRAAAVVRRAQALGDVFVSDQVDQPSTFFSCIILPAAATAWGDARLRAVLLHEGAHVARRDTLLGLLGDAACAVYWFHPLSWLTARRARLERERACDDAVLTRGIDPADYATALLDVARQAHGRLSHGLAMAERTHLGQRITAILDSGVNRRTTRAARAGVLAAAITAAPLLAALTTLSIPLPRSGEPDLRGDAIASPFSERIGVSAVHVGVDASGPDAIFIASLQALSTRAPAAPVDFVADRARWALGRIEDGELVTPLMAATRDRDWRVRAYAAWALGNSAASRAVAPLATLLDDDVWRVRAAAAAALRRLADPAASGPMKRALSDDAWQVRSEAVHYFATCCAASGDRRELFETMRRDRHIAVRGAAEEALQ
jgi:hypothetical protein